MVRASVLFARETHRAIVRFFVANLNDAEEPRVARRAVAADRYRQLETAYACSAICLPRRLRLVCIHNPGGGTPPPHRYTPRLPPTKQTSLVRACNMRKAQDRIAPRTASLCARDRFDIRPQHCTNRAYA